MNSTTFLLSMTTVLLLGTFIGKILFSKREREKRELTENEKGIVENKLALVLEEKNRLSDQSGENNKRIIELERNIAVFENEKKNLEDRIRTHQADLEKLHSQFSDQFENLSNKIFEKHTNKFKTDSEKSLSDLLSPFKERIKEFQGKVEQFYGDEARERASLKTEIKSIVSANEEITKEAHNLTLALKGDSKTQGNWGEFVLERILEASGLREGEEYTVQGKDLQLANDDGRRSKPDIIVHLPDGKHIIVDSKVSLTNYENHINGTDENERGIQLNKFLDSIHSHVDNLHEKKYHHLEQLITPEVVLMFMPLEGAFALAMQKKKDLWPYAWDKFIVIVSPTTLFATLRTIESMWKRERQNKNAMEIARQAGGLYDKFANFIDDLEGVGVSIKKTEEAYQNALNKLKLGRGNLISRVENIRKLGAKSTKALPEKYLLEEGSESET